MKIKPKHNKPIKIPKLEKLDNVYETGKKINGCPLTIHRIEVDVNAKRKARINSLDFFIVRVYLIAANTLIYVIPPEI